MKKKSPSRWFHLGPFTVFDIETTGMSPARDRIIEIAAIRIDVDGSQTEFQALVNPGRRIPAAVSRIHHITDDMVADADDFSRVGEGFLELSQDSILVAHNARFDLSFLQESLQRESLGVWKGKAMDSIPIIKQAYPGLPSYSLQYLKTRFGLGDGTGQAHRALVDVGWTVEVLSLALQAILDNTRQ